MNRLPIVLSIAGSDNTGGAGIQADIKTCSSFRVYCCTAITAVTAQNCSGVRASQYCGREILEEQLEMTIKMMRPDSVKVGLMPTRESVEITSSFIRRYQLRNVVVDPVLGATSGSGLNRDVEGICTAMKSDLFPIADVITPNIPEAEKLARIKQGENIKIKGIEYQRKLAEELLQILPTTNILIKGGHSEASEGEISDLLLLSNGKEHIFTKHWIETRHTHGTGCGFSTAIACGLAEGYDIIGAADQAELFINRAIKNGALYPVVEDKGPICYF